MLNFTDELRVVRPSDFAVVLSGMASRMFYIEFSDRFGRGRYICSYDGLRRVNNVVEGDAVRLIFENYTFATSVKDGLWYRSLERFPDSKFADGYRDVWTAGTTPIYIVESGDMGCGEIEAEFDACSGGGAVTLTQSEYDALKQKGASTLYGILSSDQTYLEKLYIGELPFGSKPEDGKFDFYKFPFTLK